MSNGNLNLNAALHFLQRCPQAHLFPAYWRTENQRHTGLVAWSTSSSNSVEQINAWAAQWPTCYFCVDLRPAELGGKSDLCVIDIDRKHGKNGDDTLLDHELSGHVLPPTLTAATPSNGTHLFYKGAVKNSVGVKDKKLGAGIDTPVMVPVPGTGVPGKGEYRIVSDQPVVARPQWVADFAGKAVEKPAGPIDAACSPDTEPNLLTAVEYLVNEAPPAEQGSRDITCLQVALRLGDFGISAASAARLMSTLYADKVSFDESFTDQDMLKKVAQAYKPGTRHSAIGCDTPEAMFPEDAPPQRSVHPIPPTRDKMAMRDAELNAARLTPVCIVENYLYADVAAIFAPGGTGKTTMLLYEMICIVLQKDLFGQKVVTPGWCLYITAEDGREILVARLREIMNAMWLTAEERAVVMRDVLIWDVSGERRAKLLAARDGSVEITPWVTEVVDAYKNDPPVLTVFDPAISFGAGEKFVNDNEQGLVECGRILVRNLGCCARFVAHTGKANAREKTLDQYTGRGGSALPDGARMVAVLQSWRPGDKLTPPAGCAVAPDTSITVLSRPKLSYAPPNPPLIWVKRTGWSFNYLLTEEVSEEDRRNATLLIVEQYLALETEAGKIHSRSSFETALPKNIVRSDKRWAIDQLIAIGRFREVELPKEKRHGKLKYCLELFSETTAD